MTAIDLNVDLGELPGPQGEQIDAALLQIVSSANVACGGHAGDRRSMRRVCGVAARHGVTVGAHVSYPDRDGFGRRSMRLPTPELRDSLMRQIEALVAAASDSGTSVAYVKPHGALYNDAAADPLLAATLTGVVAEWHLGVLTLPEQQVHRVARESGVQAYTEAFADRGYRSDGSLVPRTEPGALLTDEQAVVDRVVALATTRMIRSHDGEVLQLRVDSVCLHSDTPGAVRLAQRLHLRLTGAEIAIAPFASSPP